MTSIGVTLRIVLAVVSGWLILDPLIAGFVALNIIWSGWQVIRESFGGLMDEGLPEKTLADHGGDRAWRRRGCDRGARPARSHQRSRDLRRFPHGRAGDHADHPGARDLRPDRASIKETTADALVTIHVEPEEKAKLDPDAPGLAIATKG